MAHEHSVYMLLADTAAQRRDADAVERYAPRLQALAERDDHRLFLAIAHRAWGVALRLRGRHDAAEARLQQARLMFGQLSTNWQLARTLVELAELALARGETAIARGHLTQALAGFEAMGARPDVERTRAALAALDT